VVDYLLEKFIKIRNIKKYNLIIMSSTRNLNTTHDYNVKKQESININKYMLYNGFGNNENLLLSSVI
jgi:hypothetical protein